jgi:Flp pilus assembly protein TadD
LRAAALALEVGDHRRRDHVVRPVAPARQARPQVELGLVDLFTAQGRFADAEGVLKEMMASDPNDALALMRFGIMKSRMQRPNEALEPLEKAVEVNPTLLDARAELGYLLFRGDMQGNVGRCVTIMNEILVTGLAA